MSKELEIKSKSVQTTAAYEGDVYKAEISFSQNGEAEVTKIDMTIYKKSNNGFVGNANANLNGVNSSTLQWSINSVPQSLLTEVTAFVNEVASSISEYASSVSVARSSD